jgi:hypothetical protein
MLYPDDTPLIIIQVDYQFLNISYFIITKAFMYMNWFHWIMSEFIGYSEQDLVKK